MQFYWYKGRHIKRLRSGAIADASEKSYWIKDSLHDWSPSFWATSLTSAMPQSRIRQMVPRPGRTDSLERRFLTRSTNFVCSVDAHNVDKFGQRVRHGDRVQRIRWLQIKQLLSTVLVGKKADGSTREGHGQLMELTRSSEEIRFKLSDFFLTIQNKWLIKLILGFPLSRFKN